MKAKKKLKALRLVLLSVFLISLLAACGKRQEHQESVTGSQSGTKALESLPDKSEQDILPPQNEGKILIVYFSRWGNTEYPDNIDASTSASVVIDGGRFGTTEYVARMIQNTVGGDIHLIETAVRYTADFDELRDVNHAEMSDNFLPQLKESSLDISKYDTIFVGYPVWATDVPRAVLSFLNEYDLSQKTVIPFCTHDGYGAGGSYGTVGSATKTTKILDGIAIEAKDVADAKESIEDWLEAIGISVHEDKAAQAGETPIRITIGETVLNGVLYDTALAQEIKEQLLFL